MRFRSLLKWDIRFQMKYGFYFLYTVLTIFYLIIIFALPESWRNATASITVYSDPAAMGMFFMGAVILLEKSQRVPFAMCVSPVRTHEYIWSKIISFIFISEIVAMILAIPAGLPNPLLVFVGIAMTSATFTLIGIVLATKVRTLNQFLIITVPFEILCFVPPVMQLWDVLPKGVNYYPFVSGMMLVSRGEVIIPGLVLSAVLLVVLYYFAKKSVDKMWQTTASGE